MSHNITLNNLAYIFPVDTVWHFNRSEIVGYSVSKNLHFVIEDGLCRTRDDCHLLSVYRPKNKNHQVEWIPQKHREYSYKYLDEEKILEKWVIFRYKNQRIVLKEKINRL